MFLEYKGFSFSTSSPILNIFCFVLRDGYFVFDFYFIYIRIGVGVGVFFGLVWVLVFVLRQSFMG